MSVETFNPASAVNVTDAAKKHFLSQLSASDDNSGVRLSIKESGCTGYMYVVEIVSGPEESDIAIALEGDKALFVSSEALPIVQGTEIDMTQEGVNHVLTFRNPNVASECGCGESFSVS